MNAHSAEVECERSKASVALDPVRSRHVSSRVSGHRHDGRVRPERNWAGNHAYRFARFHEPDTLDELISLVDEATRLRVVASRHCFNDIGDTDAVAGDLVSLRRLPTSP